MPLVTPFGEIVVEANCKPCDYLYESLPNKVYLDDGQLWFSVDGRYKITPCINELSLPIDLKCSVNTGIVFDRSEMTGDEQYAAASMYANNINLCIGCFDELEGEILKADASGDYYVDGDGLLLNDCTATGIEIHIGKYEYLKDAYFCVAWKTLSGDDYDTNGSFDVFQAAEPVVSGL